MVAITSGGARRFHPACGCFAAVENHSAVALADLAAPVAEHGDLALLERDPPTAVLNRVLALSCRGWLCSAMLTLRTDADPPK